MDFANNNNHTQKKHTAKQPGLNIRVQKHTLGYIWEEREKHNPVRFRFGGLKRCVIREQKRARWKNLMAKTICGITHNAYEPLGLVWNGNDSTLTSQKYPNKTLELVFENVEARLFRTYCLIPSTLASFSPPGDLLFSDYPSEQTYTLTVISN